MVGLYLFPRKSEKKNNFQQTTKNKYHHQQQLQKPAIINAAQTSYGIMHPDSKGEDSTPVCNPTNFRTVAYSEHFLLSEFIGSFFLGKTVSIKKLLGILKILSSGSLYPGSLVTPKHYYIHLLYLLMKRFGVKLLYTLTLFRYFFDGESSLFFQS